MESGVPDDYDMDFTHRGHAFASSIGEQRVLAYYTGNCAMDWESDKLVELYSVEYFDIGKVCADGWVAFNP